MNCTVTKADVYAVLVALEDVIIDALKSGEMVRLFELGTLQSAITAQGAVTEKDFNDSLIKKARINFRPGTALNSILGNLTNQKVKVKSSKPDEEKEEEGGDLSA